MIFACADDKPFEPYFQKENAWECNKSRDLISREVLEFPLDSSLRFSTNSLGVTSIRGREYLSFLDADLMTLVIFDYKDPDKLRKVQFEYEGPNGVGNLSNSAHYLHTFDSIYLFHHWSGALLHMTDSGKVANRYPLTDYSDPANFPMPFPSTTSPILYSQGKLFIPCTTTLYQSDYRNYPSSLSVDLTTNKVQFLSLFPELYSKAHWGPKFKYEPGMAYNPATEELVLSYPVDPFLQIVNLRTKEVSQHFVGSEYFEAIPPFKQDPSHYLKRVKGTIYPEEDDHGLSTSDYRGIYYDQNQNLFYRVALIRPSLEKLSVSRAPDFSIIVLNERFEKLGERLFSSKVYDPSKIFLSSTGINLFRRDMYNENENKIAIEVFGPAEIRDN
ncbi:MAG: DUF4221 family protein [Cyclobacterium sp.]|uniref:DUF4221 family protein n=1 Tax=Cyclobacterium sp. TaxID=1966343 RepID=UPI003970A094